MSFAKDGYFQRSPIMAASLKPLNEQVIVITGASSGIGLATARAAAKAGARVVLVARSETALAEIAAEIELDGGIAVYAVADVANRNEVADAAAVAIKHFGRINAWINDAGVSIFGRLDEVSDQDSRRLFDTNFWGVVNGSLVALPYLKRQGGALINLGSEVSDAVIPLQGMYSASKHAVKGFTDALRIELEEIDGAPISITLIQPTAVNTPYPQHAKNYMDHEPSLPSPQLDPFKVAEAILHAATNPERDITVGAMAKMNTAMSKFIPSLADKMAAHQVKRQQYDEPPRNPEGTLYQAGGTGEVYGRGGRVQH
jgi:short-subunit dehydrogenase